MKRGAWHQFGDRSQKLVREQLEHGQGVGVIISPRDLTRNKAIEYAQEYHKLGADVLIDQQFYVPGFSNKKLATYPIDECRMTVSRLNSITDEELTKLITALQSIHGDLQADGLIAPAVVYEAGRTDIIKLNARLFRAAKQVGGNLGIPTYATVMLGRSVTSSSQTIDPILSRATSLDADGWYYGFEFGDERVPSARDPVLRCCSTGLTLACTGKPVLHAYAALLALLSFGFGATGAAVGHSQNLWQFTRDRWEPPTAEGGGGEAPPRFFSRSLWGTIIYPDETAQLSATLRSQVLTHSPFSTPVASNTQWSRWDTNKHLVNVICSTVTHIAETKDARENSKAAMTLLQSAVNLHSDIAATGLTLRDNTNVYQENWRAATEELREGYSGDFDYLGLLD